MYSIGLPADFMHQALKLSCQPSGRAVVWQIENKGLFSITFVSPCSLPVFSDRKSKRGETHYPARKNYRIISSPLRRLAFAGCCITAPERPEAMKLRGYDLGSH
jgi:hypothetical protein